MIIEPYNARVRQYFDAPQHAGVVAGGATACLADQGISIELTARVEDETLVEMRWRARGCPHVLAACEAVCRHFEGRPTAALRDFDAARLQADLAVPVEKTGRILVIEDTCRSLGQAVRTLTQNGSP